LLPTVFNTKEESLINSAIALGLKHYETRTWQIGRYAWKIENIQAIKAIPFSGSQGLKEVSHQVIKQITYA
jgi:hypothetical protein